MNHLTELQPAKPGDAIRLNGKDYVIKEIVDQWEEWAAGVAFYAMEITTEDGHCRIWKQYFDGGELIRRKIDDKVTVVKKLEELLKTTRQFSDLDYCKYEIDKGNEYVHVVGKPNETGYRWKYKVNVTWDSGIALIWDVMNTIY